MDNEPEAFQITVFENNRKPGDPAADLGWTALIPISEQKSLAIDGYTASDAIGRLAVALASLQFGEEATDKSKIQTMVWDDVQKKLVPLA